MDRNIAQKLWEIYNSNNELMARLDAVTGAQSQSLADAVKAVEDAFGSHGANANNE